MKGADSSRITRTHPALTSAGRVRRWRPGRGPRGRQPADGIRDRLATAQHQRRAGLIRTIL
eukprot:1750235-Prymnesium_polylepis.1